MKLFFLAGVLGLLVACADPFQAAQDADTIESYEAFLAEHPDSRWTDQATLRLEELYIAKAKEEGTLAAFDRYLERFPEGQFRDKGMAGREEFLFEWAKKENTTAGWQKFLDEYPRAQKKKRRKQAKRMLRVTEYTPHIDISEARISQVNLAEDPNGPLNGWAFEVDVTNNGTKTLTTLELTIWYLDENGNALDERSWPVVAPIFPSPVKEELKKPMKPGDTRPWFWSTGRIPENWGKKAKIFPSKIIYEKSKGKKKRK